MSRPSLTVAPLPAFDAKTGSTPAARVGNDGAGGAGNERRGCSKA